MALTIRIPVEKSVPVLPRTPIEERRFPPLPASPVSPPPSPAPQTPHTPITADDE